MVNSGQKEEEEEGTILPQGEDERESARLCVTKTSRKKEQKFDIPPPPSKRKRKDSKRDPVWPWADTSRRRRRRRRPPLFARQAVPMPQKAQKKERRDDAVTEIRMRQRWGNMAPSKMRLILITPPTSRSYSYIGTFFYSPFGIKGANGTCGFHVTTPLPLLSSAVVCIFPSLTRKESVNVMKKRGML